MNARGLLASIAVLTASATVSNAQPTPAQAAPRALVESLRVTDSLSREAAIQLRAALRERVQPTVLQVIPTDVVDRTERASVGVLGRRWEWNGVRDFGRQVGAQYIIDIGAIRDSTTVQITAFVVHPVRTGEPAPMPIFADRTLNGAVAKLAEHLADRSWTPR
jgi:hypothetical protein